MKEKDPAAPAGNVRQQTGNAQQQNGRNPADAFMRTAMESIKAMVDVNTILGVPVQAPDGSVIIPVSRVSFGFVAGGSEFEGDAGRGGPLPFGGASGAGVSLSPVAFLVVSQGQVRLLPVSDRALYDRLLDLVPWVAERIRPWGSRDGRSGAQQQVEPARAAQRGGDSERGGSREGAGPGDGPDSGANRQEPGTGRRGSMSVRFE